LSGFNDIYMGSDVFIASSVAGIAGKSMAKGGGPGRRAVIVGGKRVKLWGVKRPILFLHSLPAGGAILF
jgi:hypothetical protein